MFSRLPEWLKYLKYLKYLNSSACEEICLVFWFLFGWSEEKFSTEKNKRGKKTKKQNLKLGEETPGPGLVFYKLLIFSVLAIFKFSKFDRMLGCIKNR